MIFERWDDLPAKKRETMISNPSSSLRLAAKTHIIGLLCFAQSLSGQILISHWGFNSGSLNPQSGLGEARLVGGTAATFAAGYEGEPAGAWNIKSFPAQGTLPGPQGFSSTCPPRGILLSDSRSKSDTATPRPTPNAYSGPSMANSSPRRLDSTSPRPAPGPVKPGTNGRWICP